MIEAFSIFFAAILFQGFFAGYETGYLVVKANPIRVRYRAEEENNPKAKRLLRLLDKPDLVLTMLLLGTNLGTIGGTIAITRGFEGLVRGDLLAVLVATPLVMVFAEIVPKSVFQRHPNRLAIALVTPMRFFFFLFYPLSFAITLVTRVIRWFSGVKEGDSLTRYMTSAEDVRKLVDASAERGTIEAEERRMIHSVIDLRETQANEVMCPRIDVQAVPLTATRGDLLKMFVETGRTRLPVYQDSLDTIIGQVNVYDVMLDENESDSTIARFVGEIMHVPDTMKIGDLLKNLRADRQHLAVVIDEYGGTDGVVATEDILEEIFGDIQDEHDSEEKQIVNVAPNIYLVDARMSRDEAAETMGIAIADEEVDTVGGWVMHLAGRIPAKGDRIEVPGVVITVVSAKATHVKKVRIEVTPEPPTT